MNILQPLLHDIKYWLLQELDYLYVWILIYFEMLQWLKLNTYIGCVYYRALDLVHSYLVH